MNLSKMRKLSITAGVVILTLLLHLTIVAAADFPRAIHLSWQSDPATTMTIMWRSASEATGAVDYGRSSDYTHSAASETHNYRYGRTHVYWHTVEITDLEPNTTYHYRIRTSEPWESEDYTFKTGIPQGEESPFRFAVMTDSQGGYSNQAIAFEMVKAENVDFILFLGDFTDTGNQQEWDVWFESGEGVLAEIPLLSVLGNHEGNQITYWDQFALPGLERWYSLVFGNTHLVFLNTNTQAEVERQRPVLLEVLENNESTWTIAMGHHPMYSSVTSKPEYQFITDAWLDVMEEYGVDLYFAGHNHCYERTWPIKDGSINEDGIVHIVHGPVGNKYYSVESQWWSKVIKADTSMYSIYEVEGQQIRATAKGLDGTIIDQFEINKGGQN